MALISIPFNKLGESADLIAQAYADDGLGALCVTDIPGYPEARDAAMHYGHKLATQPSEKLAQVEDPTSLYNAGWSHGKEKLGDVPDLAKGSFYFNPLKDVTGTEEQRKDLPAVYPSNVWPQEEGELAGFKDALTKLGKILFDVSLGVATGIDHFFDQQQVPRVNGKGLHASMKEAERAKSRLLYYFAKKEESPCAGPGWIGWHNDSGFLTAIPNDIFVEESTGKIVPNPDPEMAGLWVATRSKEDIRVTVPPNSVLVQCGECTQVVSGGKLIACPHAVRGPRDAPDVARVSMPLFVDIAGDSPLAPPPGVTVANLDARLSSDKVPKLAGRLCEDGNDTFGSFLQRTFQAYYEHNKN